jgi:hypothetical protein
MAFTVANLRTRAAKRYPDLEDGGTLGLDLFQETHDDILAEIPMVLDTEDIALTDDDPTYPVDEDILRIWEATWRRSATANDIRLLRVVTQEWMDLHHRGWKYLAAQTEPNFLVLEATADAAAVAQFRFSPNLDITVSGAYPKVTLTVTRKQTLAANSTLPQQVKDPDAYLEGVWWRFAKLYLDDDRLADRHEQRYLRAKAKLFERVRLISPEIQPVIYPGWTQGQRAL